MDEKSYEDTVEESVLCGTRNKPLNYSGEDEPFLHFSSLAWIHAFRIFS
jgi:hypothetical protein